MLRARKYLLAYEINFLRRLSFGRHKHRNEGERSGTFFFFERLVYLTSVNKVNFYDLFCVWKLVIQDGSDPGSVPYLLEQSPTEWC